MGFYIFVCGDGLCEGVVIANFLAGTICYAQRHPTWGARSQVGARW